MLKNQLLEEKRKKRLERLIVRKEKNEILFQFALYRLENKEGTSKLIESLFH